MKTKAQKKPYQGKPKRSMSAAPTFKKPYSKASKLSIKLEFPPCRVCNDGVLRPTQWNRIVCSSNTCMNSELA